MEIEPNTDDVYQLNAGEIAAINEGLVQLNTGEFLSNEESNARIDQWLKRSDGKGEL